MHQVWLQMTCLDIYILCNNSDPVWCISATEISTLKTYLFNSIQRGVSHGN